jgi:hypothetical protein
VSKRLRHGAEGANQADMKITDDYRAKIRLWAANPRVVPLPPGPRLPRFRARKFSSHAEMNAWKRELVLELARRYADNR